ncbi:MULTISPECIES: pseudouridine synthase [unclassified Butyrivibrio]|uniref:pseudouridine synthase n=1 Tax=unclassified Butyrivibrio TaxID=2639466 RepID=UPI0003B5631E|nr:MULTISPECIES: pseudouridine synthase [unclassified Butyrivibrio]MDC7295274.1 rRNA pseudouridine synthase [Butyrivibrio sp. DSM 10294]
MRLNQYIASCGVCSRREADKLIDAGRVTVNGNNAQPGIQVTDKDVVTVDGRKIEPSKSSVVIAYYKPVGVTCTEKDEHAERTVIEDLSYNKRVTYAGRLDKDSEGLLLMTDDGKLIDAMMKGAKRHEKEYEVTVDKPLNGDFLKKMSSGVYLKELDQTTRGCKVNRTGKCSFNIILTQGLNRQIRRMCKTLGYEVKKLKRIRVMTIKLEDYKLAPGKYVELSEADKKKLYLAAGLRMI